MHAAPGRAWVSVASAAWGGNSGRAGLAVASAGTAGSITSAGCDTPAASTTDPSTTGPSTPGQTSLRVFWWHPSLTDYRLPLFELMARRCTLDLMLMRPGVPVPPALQVHRATVSTRARRAVASHLGHLVWLDAASLLSRLRSADVFVTSFSLNLYSMLGLAWAHALGVPVVVWEELQRMPRRGRLAAVRRALLRWMAARVDAWYVMGEPQYELLLSLGVRRGRVFRSAEAAAPEPAGEPQTVALPFPATRPVALFLGRLIPIKGVDVLLRAFAGVCRQMPQACLVIAGDGESRGALEAQARELGLARNVVFLGHVAAPAAKSWLLRRANVLAVPSVYLGDWGEGGPLVIPEALVAGTPVVCSSACGNTVDHVRRVGHGAVVPPGDAGELADALLAFLRQSPDRDAVRRAAAGLPDHAHQAETLWAAINHARDSAGAAPSAGQGAAQPS